MELRDSISKALEQIDGLFGTYYDEIRDTFMRTDDGEALSIGFQVRFTAEGYHAGRGSGVTVETGINFVQERVKAKAKTTVFEGQQTFDFDQTKRKEPEEPRQLTQEGVCPDCGLHKHLVREIRIIPTIDEASDEPGEDVILLICEDCFQRRKMPILPDDHEIVEVDGVETIMGTCPGCGHRVELTEVRRDSDGVALAVCENCRGSSVEDESIVDADYREEPYYEEGGKPEIPDQVFDQLEEEAESHLTQEEMDPPPRLDRSKKGKKGRKWICRSCRHKQDPGDPKFQDVDDDKMDPICFSCWQTKPYRKEEDNVQRTETRPGAGSEGAAGGAEGEDGQVQPGGERATASQ
jgi:hypothetical protein